MGMIIRDVRYGTRLLLKHPGFTAAAVLALALGIGANTAIFSVVSGVLLRPLPYPAPTELVAVRARDSHKSESGAAFSWPDFADLQARAKTFADLAAYTGVDFTLTNQNSGEAIHLPGAQVTSSLFPVLRVRPMLGRNFLPGEDGPGHRVIILGYALWQRAFAGDPRIVGETVQMEGADYRVVGVMPEGFRFPILNEPAEFWTTLSSLQEVTPGSSDSEANQRGNHFLRVIGRLRAGVSPEQAQADASAILGSLALQYPETNKRFNAALVVPWLQDLTADVRPALLVLLGAAFCVLLIACANVANLLLARATTRHKEIAIRSALGASRARLVRQLLSESMLLALLGGFAGFLLAIWATEGMAALLPADFPRAGEIAPNLGVFAFNAVFSLGTGLIFGLAPALRISRPEIAASLSESSRGSTDSPRARHLRNALVVSEIVLAFVLLTAAGLFIRSFWRLQHVDPGFRPHNVLTANLSIPDLRDVQAPIKHGIFYRRLLEKIGRIPGVAAASAVTPLPLSGSNWATGFDIASQPVPKSDRSTASVRIVAPHYFETMGIPIRKGRDFDTRDAYGAPGVAVVNETLARLYFPGGNAVGQRITPQISFDVNEPIERQIIGVVGDVKFRNLSGADKPELYVPHAQMPSPAMTLVVRSDLSPAALLPALRESVAELDKGLPLYQPRTMEQYLATALAQPRLNMTLLLIFAGAAVFLTAVGIYSVMAFSVAQRTQEIAIRMALGAQRVDVLRLIVGHGLRLVLAALAVGALLAFLFGKTLTSLLYGANASDLLTLLSVAGVLGTIALLACWAPARRASEIDPMTALRTE